MNTVLLKIMTPRLFPIFTSMANIFARGGRIGIGINEIVHCKIFDEAVNIDTMY